MVNTYSVYFQRICIKEKNLVYQRILNKYDCLFKYTAKIVAEINAPATEPTNAMINKVSIIVVLKLKLSESLVVSFLKLKSKWLIHFEAFANSNFE